MNYRYSPFLQQRRGGKTLVTLVILLPAIFGIIGLVFDGGLLMSRRRDLQHATDAASQASAMDLMQGATIATAKSTAVTYLQDYNGFDAATITTNVPPTSGNYSGRDGFVEVIAEVTVPTRFMHLFGTGTTPKVQARSVAGFETSTAKTVIAVLDPHAEPISPPIFPIASLNAPALVGALEVIGVGEMRVDGAVIVNSTWGGVDEDGNNVGESAPPPYGVFCTPILTKLTARDVRVSGGVFMPSNYENFESGGKSPLQANRMSVPDPFDNMPVPTTITDGVNVDSTNRGTIDLNVPLMPTTTAQPGVYDWINVTAGDIEFSPGIYIVRGRHPATNLAVNLLGTRVIADGVMFYITNSSTYDADTGLPDANDGDAEPAPPTPLSLLPSVQINLGLATASYSGLSDASSPFDGMLLYQRRRDRRPIVIGAATLTMSTFNGDIYAKWGHVSLVSNGNHDTNIAAGTARMVPIAGMTLAPSQPLPEAEDVYLVE